MQEADADDALTGADVLGRAGAGLGVDFDVLVQVDEVLDAFVMALELDHEVGDQFRGAGGLIVGEPDQALVLGLEQVVPGLGRFEAHALELVTVDHEAEEARVDAVPVAIGILVHVLGQVAGIDGVILIQQALRLVPPNQTSAEGLPFSSSIFAGTSPVERR